MTATEEFALQFDSEDAAESVLERLEQMHRLDDLTLVGAVAKERIAVAMESTGMVTYTTAIENQVHPLTYSLQGGLLGLFLGLAFPIPGFMIGVGALFGGLEGLKAKERAIFKSGLVQEICADLQIGKSAIIFSAVRSRPDIVIHEIGKFYPRVMRTSLSLIDEQSLREAFKAQEELYRQTSHPILHRP